MTREGPGSDHLLEALTGGKAEPWPANKVNWRISGVYPPQTKDGSLE